jgi:succinate dehydrogenase/fumarate reductase flavoprotein subunit
MLTVAAVVAEGGLQREESRGTHFRSDAPERDDRRFCRRIFLERAGDGGIHSELGPLSAPSDERAE